MASMSQSGVVSQAVKGRLYPSKTQADTMHRMRYLLACIRERIKAEAREYYERHEKGCPAGWLQKEIAQPMHRKLDMVCDARSVAQVVATVRRSYVNWWKRPDHFKAPAKRHPDRHPANIYVHNQRLVLDRERGYVRLLGNKVGWMKWRSGRWPEGKIMSGRVSHRGGHWYLAVSFEGAPPNYPDPVAEAIGVDPGIRQMTAHDGERSMVFPRVPERSKKRRRQLQRKLSRCKPGSARYKRLRATRARLEERQANVRRDMSHKATRKLVDHARVIGYEDPSAKAWQQSGMFGEASREAGAGEFCRQLVYKGEWAGRDVVAVPESEASTQTCHECGERTPHDLGKRTFRCDHCDHTNGRDINAALNVRRRAIEGARAARPEAVG